MSYNPYSNDYYNGHNAPFPNYGYPPQQQQSQRQQQQEQQHQELNPPSHPPYNQYDQLSAQNSYYAAPQTVNAGAYATPAQPHMNPSAMGYTNYTHPHHYPYGQTSVVGSQFSNVQDYVPAHTYTMPTTNYQYQNDPWQNGQRTNPPQPRQQPAPAPQLVNMGHSASRPHSSSLSQQMLAKRQSSHSLQEQTPATTSKTHIVPPQARPEQQPVISGPDQQPIVKPPPQTASTPAKSERSETDFHLVLLSLAEEYVTAAYRIGPQVARYQDPEAVELYYKLMATGIGCLEKALNLARPAPRSQAHLLLVYASLLYQETNDRIQLETALNKGIPVAERNKLMDLKYGMEYLSVQALSTNKAAAGLAAVEKYISNTTLLNHVPWTYAFRFLQINLAVNAGENAQLRTAIRSARDLQTLAQNNSDLSIIVMAAAIEAMLHLRSGAVDGSQNAQHAIASARKWQLQKSATTPPAQVWALLDCVDLVSHICQHNSEQAPPKMEALQRLSEGLMDSSSEWLDDEELLLPLSSHHDPALTTFTNGIFARITPSAPPALKLLWFQKRDFYAIVFYLSSVTAQIKSHPSKKDPKAKIYLLEGLKLFSGDNLDSANNSASKSSVSGSLSSTSVSLRWRNVLYVSMQLHLGMIHCNVGDWEAAQEVLSELEIARQNPAIKSTAFLYSGIKYFSAVVAQATGDLSNASRVYRDMAKMLPKPSSTRLPTAQDDLRILATLNLLLITSDPRHPDYSSAATTIESLEPLLQNHPNRALYSTLNLLRVLYADVKPDTHHGASSGEASSVQRKSHLQSALSIARVIHNQQLLSAAIAVMNDFFFRGMVGPQASKSLRTGLVLAQQGAGPLVQAAASSMYVEMLERETGKETEVKQKETELRALAARLPEEVRRKAFETQNGSSSTC